MSVHKIVIVGNGRMAQRCAEIVLAQATATIGLIVTEDRRDMAQARLAKFCNARNVPLLISSESINSRPVIEKIAAVRPAFLLSIDNFQVFGTELLDIATHGAVNFHNGPIERYRGVNVPSWAIFNGEHAHGVSWHDMEARVDSGALVASRRFDLDDVETGLSLTVKCIEVGIEIFESHLERLLAGTRSAVAPAADIRNYRRSDLPNGGVLDLRWSYPRIDRMLRATDFRPFPNTFTYARVCCPNGELIVNEARRTDAAGVGKPGEVLVANDRLIVACADGAIELAAIMLEPDREADIATAITALGLEKGQIIS